MVELDDITELLEKPYFSTYFVWLENGNVHLALVNHDSIVYLIVIIDSATQEVVTQSEYQEMSEWADENLFGDEEPVDDGGEVNP